MGKSTKKSNSKDAAVPKCTCTDPYICACTNRPPRPSRGHKWNSETQEWTGKGHKQKGASGQVSSVAVAAVTTSLGKTTVEAWQRLPSALLDEYVRKQKRPQAKYKQMDAAPSGKKNNKCNSNSSLFRYRVILPDPKNSDKDLFFVPQHAVANEEQAKEEAALLALLSLTPNLPHERKLPEPYKQTWLHAREAQKKATPTNDKKQQQAQEAKQDQQTNESDPSASAVTTTSQTAQQSSTTSAPAIAAQSSTLLAHSIPSFASQADRRQHQLQQKQQRNERIRHHEAIRLANLPHRVFMSAMVRRQIEALLRGERVVDLESADGDDNESDNEQDNETNNPAVDGNEVRAYVLQRLVGEGFTRKQARIAFQECSNTTNIEDDEEEAWDNVYEGCLQWLLVHLQDDQLPEGFDPQEGMLDVIAAPKAAAAASSSSPDANGGFVHQRFSIAREDAAYVMSQANSTKQAPEDAFWNMIVGEAKVSLASTDMDSVAKADNQELLDSEIEAVASIYDDACAVVKGELDTEISVQIPETKLSVQFVVQNGLYPSTWPSRILVSGAWESTRTVGVAMHIELVRFMTESLSLGDFMLLELIGRTQELLAASDDLPCSSLRPVAAKERVSVEIKPVVETKRNNSQAPNRWRPRDRAKFWSVLPKDTPAAAARPKISKLLEVARESLPAANARAEFLDKLEACTKTGNVMLVTGSTGCGKTTQICQFILEAYPKDAKIVVAQPRRLAATGVATRVAEERGEPRPGVDSVGYVVRGDSAICDKTRLVFCTTGVLLRQLQNDHALDCLTHILVDECHERSLDSDVLLGILKQVKASYPKLKIILMSATIDAQRMAAYWGSKTPTMDIPGRTFPVTDYTLEDVLALTHTTDPVAIEDLCKKQAKVIDYDHIGRLVKALVERREKTDDGSILIFLPGAPEIGKATDAIKKRTEGIPLTLLPLHGGLQSKDQNSIFRPPPFGSTKVILSTNIAETSVTIPDCTVVIDTCREKQSSYDPLNRMPLLVEQYASKASLKQRRGRAGRVRAGVCYKLISKGTLYGLAEHSEPEIRRCALDQTLLSLLFLGMEDGLGSFVNTLLDPPTKESLHAASESLRMLGAVDFDATRGIVQLTPLGKHLAGIPAPPTIGKLLVMGSILGCRSAAIGMAAGLSVNRSPLLNVDDNPRWRNQEQNEEDVAKAAKSRLVLRRRKELAEKVGNSDHALMASIYIEWMAPSGQGSKRKAFCEELGLSFATMKDMEQLGKLLDAALRSIGFEASSEADRHSSSPRIIHTCAVSAMSPSQLVKVVRPKTTYNETAQGAKEKDNRSKDLKFFIRLPASTSNSDSSASNEKEERVFVHPSSSNFLTGTYSCPWLVYFQLLRTSKPFLRDVTECSPYALLLFGGPLTVHASKDLIMIDDWVTLSANARIGSLVGALRRQVDQLLTLKTADASADISNTDTMKLITSILKTDGIGGAS